MTESIHGKSGKDTCKWGVIKLWIRSRGKNKSQTLRLSETHLFLHPLVVFIEGEKRGCLALSAQRVGREDPVRVISSSRFSCERRAWKMFHSRCRCVSGSGSLSPRVVSREVTGRQKRISREHAIDPKSCIRRRDTGVHEHRGPCS